MIANFAFQGAGGSVSYDANSSGVLPAGTYSLSILFQVTANEFGGTAGGLYTFSLTLVPEPSSVCLMLAGTFLLAAAGRRMRLVETKEVEKGRA